MPGIIVKATGDPQAGQLFHAWWDTTELPDWNTYLNDVGLSLVKTLPPQGTATLDADTTEIGAPDGIGFRPSGWETYGEPELNPDEVMLTHVLPGGAGERAGLEQYDILESLDGRQVTRDSLPSILAAHRAGDRVQAIVLREGIVRSFSVVLGQDRTPRYRIVQQPHPTAAQNQRLQDIETGVPFPK
jgi:predicted metalloprotease with PDZ domain